MVLAFSLALSIAAQVPPGTLRPVPPDPAVIERALAFLGRASATLAEGHSPQPLSGLLGQLLQDGEDPNEFMFSGTDGIVILDRASGRIVSASLSPQPGEEWDEGHAISEATCLRIAKTLAIEARFIPASPAWDLSVSLRSRHGRHPTWELWVVSTYQGVRYANGHAAYFQLHHKTGRLWKALLHRIPSPPAGLIPSVSASTARLSILAHLFVVKNVTTLLEERTAELVIWRPQSLGIFPEDRFLTPAHYQMALENRSVLVYRASFADAESFSPARGDYTSRFHGYVDAQTGQLLNVDHMFPAGGGGKTQAGPALAGFRWDWPADKVHVLVGRRSATLTHASISTVVGNAPSGTSKSVVLVRDELSVRARFYPHNGLLAATISGKVVLGKPNADLRRMLELIAK